jgi:hypothetical protein
MGGELGFLAGNESPSIDSGIAEADCWGIKEE